MGYQRITNLQCDGLQKTIVIEKRLQLRLESFLCLEILFCIDSLRKNHFCISIYPIFPETMPLRRRNALYFFHTRDCSC